MVEKISSGEFFCIFFLINSFLVLDFCCRIFFGRFFIFNKKKNRVGCVFVLNFLNIFLDELFFLKKLEMISLFVRCSFKIWCRFDLSYNDSNSYSFTCSCKSHINLLITICTWLFFIILIRLFVFWNYFWHRTRIHNSSYAYE